MSKAKVIDCPACGNKTSVRAAACPACGEPVKKPKKRYGLKTLAIVFGLIVVLGAVGQYRQAEYEAWAKEHPEEAAKLEAQKAAEKAERERKRAEEKAREEEQHARAEQENRRKGFHCLSAWDGSHRGVKEYVENRLRDPDSFEHLETRITPVKNGKHTLFMTYRARNGFGGMNVEKVVAEIDSSTCGATILVAGN